MISNHFINIIYCFIVHIQTAEALPFVGLRTQNRTDTEKEEEEKETQEN